MKTLMDFSVKSINGKTVVDNAFFTSPVKIMPLQAAVKGRLNAVVMMASAGILKGDFFDYRITIGADACCRLNGQSYTKIFNTNGGSAEHKAKIQVGNGASFYYLPCTVIPFENSSFDSDIIVELEKNCEFLYTDIVAGGRIAMGECFQFKHYRSKLTVLLEGKPVFVDHNLMEPERMSLHNFMYFDGYTHQSLLYYYSDRAEKIDSIRKYKKQSEDILFAVSEAQAGVVIKMLAFSAQEIEEEFENVIALLER